MLAAHAGRGRSACSNHTAAHPVAASRRESAPTLADASGSPLDDADGGEGNEDGHVADEQGDPRLQS
eukprot:13458866-Alexandrium_andersonii.AAC.1